MLELGYLDDRDYALRRARLMAEKGWGNFPIRHTLKELGIPEDLCDETVDRVNRELSEEKRIAMLVRKRPGLDREKMIRFLSSRGFEFEKILSTLGGVGR